MVKSIDIDKERDALVKYIVARARPLHEALKDFKHRAFVDIQALIDLSIEHYGVKRGGRKGNVMLYSSDGRYKIIRVLQDRITFNERIQAAKALIENCMAELTKNARPELPAIIEHAFSTDKDGDINPARVLQLRRHDITDPRWLQAMAARAEAVQVVNSKSYIRLYERVDEKGQHRPLSLDIAGV